MINKSNKFQWLVRLGYAARGLVYMTLGYLALTTASRAKDGGEAAFDVLQDVPLGTGLLWLMSLGLLAYAIFKFISAIGDVQRHGSDPKGLAVRLGEFASAVAYTLLAYAAFQFAIGASGSSSSDQAQTAGSVLELPLGELVIGLVGVAFLAGAAMQVRSAVTAHFMTHVSSAAPAAVKPMGQVGHVARAVVFAVIGWSLIQAAWLDSARGVKGLGQAILSLRDSGAVYTLVAIGLLLFGFFSLIVARYRIVPDLHASDLKPSLR